jgi:hypothetical protein
VRRAIVLTIGAAILMAVCGCQGNKTAGIPIEPKWKGAPYRLAADKGTAKPRPTGISLPAVKFTANPDSLETRVVMVVHFDTSGAPDTGQPMNRLVLAPVDIHGAEGTLPADYVDGASKSLSEFLGAYCPKGKVTLYLALARSSLNPQAGETDVEAKRLSDWLPVEMDFKNPPAKCKAKSH